MSKTFELIQKLQEIIEARKDKNATIFQNTLNTKKCIKFFQNTTYNF